MTPDQPLGLAASRAWRIPHCLSGQTVAVLAPGHSLTASAADRCKRFWTIAVGDAGRLAPWADILYHCDARWWDYHKPAEPRGLQIGLAPAPAWARVMTLKPDNAAVLSADPEALATGSQGRPSQASSGYQAINLAYLLGAGRILLLGLDLNLAPDGGNHFFGDHPRELAGTRSWGTYARAFPPLAKELDRHGIRVINCSPGSAVRCFPLMELEKVLG